MRDIVLIAHNLRSTHNVGSLFRTADGLGVKTLYLTGYTPYPLGAAAEMRLPHLAAKIDRQIAKTALGAERYLSWQHTNIEDLFGQLHSQGYLLSAVEQAANSTALPEFKPPEKIALLVGREVEGLEPDIVAQCDRVVEIPMFGSKESYNVVQAAAIALYHCRFAP